MMSDNKERRLRGRGGFWRTAAALLAVLLVFPNLTAAFAEQKPNEIPDAEILLVYDSTAGASDKAQIGIIADTLTYLGYKVSYSKTENTYGQLTRFSNLLYYHNGSDDPKFLEELKRSSCKVMEFGDGDMTQLADALGVSADFDEIGGSSAEVTYTLPGESEISELYSVDKAFLAQGTFTYTSGKVEAEGKTAAYCVRSGRFGHIALYDNDDSLIRAAFVKEVQLWMWPYNDLPHSYAQFVVFSNVYPFFDNQHLLDVFDMLHNMGIPYVIDAMPVYSHTDYPAMKRFCELLTYAQSKGGAVILQAPLSDSDTVDKATVLKEINSAISAYCSYGVYPVGLSAPSSWMYDEDGLAVLRRFSLLVFSEDKNSGWSESITNNTIYADGHQLVMPSVSVESETSSAISAYSTAVDLDITEDLDTLKSQIQALQRSGMVLKDLWSINHSVYTDTDAIIYKNGTLYLNNSIVPLSFTPFKYDDNFDYKRGVIASIAMDLSGENSQLVKAVFFISILLTIFIILARLNNKRRFFH